MFKGTLKIISLVLNVLVFLLIFVFLTRLIWKDFGQNYIYSKPVGGDYYNALTYQAYFSKYLSLPAKSWIPYLNEGSPAIGGYPFLPFYLTYPLTKSYEVATSMNIFSLISFLLFATASLLLFWQ